MPTLRYFSGGAINAAGGEFVGSLDDAVSVAQRLAFLMVIKIVDVHLYDLI